jgi:ATP-dependent DNA helicase RecG
LRHNFPVPLSPTDPIHALPNIGPRRAQALEELGIDRVSDLLWFFPYRYEDRRHPVRIADLGHHVDEPVLLRGEVRTCGAKVSPVKRMKIFEAMLEDGSGAIMLVWFNQAYLADQIHRGDKLSVYGVPRLSHYRRLQIESPEWEAWNEGDEGAIVPIYSKVSNIAPKALRQMIAAACETLPLIDDPLPPALRKRLGVTDLAPALHEIHRPQELTADFLRQRSPAHLRVILQEFFAFQLALRLRRATEKIKRKTRRIKVNDAMRDEVRRILPFKLTAAQKRVVKEIADDLQSEKPMYRLLQGDVGSGKTIVALIAAIIAIRNGHQAALLAPTEILVEQHYQRIRQLLGDSLVVAKATGSMAAGERRTLLAGLREGFIQLAVGTHALLEERVVFKSLGLAIVDEQHRFGVAQRQRLFAKADMPDILVMTATPIPRSLALAMYGDLELSVIDELPPGRMAVKTAVRTSKDLDRVYQFIDDELDRGAQAYVVFPIIEESEKLNVKALTLGFDTMTQRFAKRRIAMLHGRMSATEKEETMQLFKSGELDMLVSTTVIEVGIDVPNASIMLILDADRFGLSQLHQLRGRVGRGARKSYCILVSDAETERLELFAKTVSGFDVAERDLELRGPGEFLGTKQSGVPRFRFGNIVRDHALMEKARDVAIETVERGLDEADALARGLMGIAVAEAERD